MSPLVHSKLLTERQLLPTISKVVKSGAAIQPAKIFQEIPIDTFRCSGVSIKNAPDADLYYFKTNNSFYLNLDETKEVAPYYYISKLWSMGKGSGTKGVHEVVNKSLHDKETMGRVCLEAASLNGETSSAGFYYKLGFRFHDSNKNNLFKEWLRHGGQRSMAPQETGLMYLPNENILHCLTYGYDGSEKDLIVKKVMGYLQSIR